MLSVDKYVDEIVNSIDGVKAEQEEIKIIIETYIEEKKEIEETYLEEIDALELSNVLEDEAEEIEEIATDGIESEEITFTEFEIILLEKLEELTETNENIVVSYAETQELLVQQENSMVEGFWMLTIIIALAIGFKIFFDNILKW